MEGRILTDLPERPGVDVEGHDVGEKGHVVVLRGDLDADSSPALRQHLDHAIRSGRTDIVVDMTELEFIDSVGLLVLVNGARRVRERGGGLVLRAVQRRVMRIFEISGLSELFRFE